MLKTLSDAKAASQERLAAIEMLATQGRYPECAAALERFLAGSDAKTKDSAGLLDAARQLFIRCQEQLALQNELAASKAADAILVETQELADYPIRLVFDNDDEDSRGKSGVWLTWDSGLDYHVVECLEQQEHLRPYCLAGALLRIQTETEAYKAGKSRYPTISDDQKLQLLALYDPAEARRVASPDWEWLALNPHPADLALSPLCMLGSSAPYMLVDARLRQRYPVLRPAQFLSLYSRFLEYPKPPKGLGKMPPGERLRERTFTALDALEGLFLDWLFAGVTDLAARYKHRDGFALGQKLWQQWQVRFPSLQPGDEFEVLDEFAGILGLSGRFSWVPSPGLPDTASERCQ